MSLKPKNFMILTWWKGIFCPIYKWERFWCKKSIKL